jgi:hypothetical protein
LISRGSEHMSRRHSEYHSASDWFCEESVRAVWLESG